MAPKIKTMHQALIFLDCRGQVREISRRAGGKYARKLVWKFVFLKAYHIQLQPLPPRELEQMCARYRLMIDWQLSPHLVSWESTLHQVTRFKARSRIFCLLPSLGRLYSAAASPSLRLRSDGSLAIIHLFRFIPPPPSPRLKAQYEFWLFETGLILYRQKYSKIAEKMASYRLSHCFYNNLLLRFFDWIARIKLRFIRKSFFQVVWKKKITIISEKQMRLEIFVECPWSRK